MANDTNVVVLVGRLAASMEVRHTQSEYPIGSFTIAVNRRKKCIGNVGRQSVVFRLRYVRQYCYGATAVFGERQAGFRDRLSGAGQVGKRRTAFFSSESCRT